MKWIINILFLLFSVSAIGQNVTIDYQAWNPSGTGCDLFVNPTNVPATGTASGIIEHQRNVGQITYSGSDQALQMQTIYETIGAVYKGDRYRIAYNFKAGYSYVVYVTAAAVENTIGFPTGPFIRVDINNVGGGGGTGCNGPQSLIPNSGGNPVAVKLSSNSFQEYGFSFPSTGALPTLQVTAFPAVDGGTKTVRVRKIRIVEIPPAASFSISSSSTSMACGTTVPVTFTVNNNGGTTGITNYAWNLGATPNGWLLPGGSPAPATYSTGTTNTLTLTPDCGKALSNISATVTANGNTYNTTNSSSISISQPSYSISGLTSLCSGSTDYTINGLVCNSSIAWTVPPSNLGSLSSLTTSPTTLTYGGTSGNLTLTANVTSCGVTTPVTYPIHVGPYTSSDYTLNVNGSVNGYLPWCPNKSYGFSVTGPVASNYVWSPLPPTGWSINYVSNYLCVLNSPSGSYPPTETLNVSFTEGCGTTISKSIFMAYSSSACITNNPCFTYSPNPAPYYLNVNVASSCIGSTYIRQIELVQASTGTSVYYQNYSYGNVTSTTITMSSYPSGNYYLRIYDGSAWSTYNIMH